MEVSADISNLLRVYKDNYAAYRVSGDATYKTRYESAKAQLDKKISDAEKTLDTDSAYIQDFLDRYADENPRIDSLHKQSKEIRKIAPAVQNEYEVSKRLNAAPQVQDVSSTILYIKAGVLVALVIGVGIAGAL